MPTLTAALTGSVPVMASGTVTISMIVNLKRFVQRDGLHDGHNVRTFERIRGTEDYAQYLERLGWQSNSLFVRASTEEDLRQAAHQMRIFRGFVLDQFFFPAYHLAEPAYESLANTLRGSLKDDQQFSDVLISSFGDWDHLVWLTRHGFAVVRMTRRFDDLPLSQIAAEVQDILVSRTGRDIYQESRTSWRIAMDVTAALVQHHLHNRIEYLDRHGQPVQVTFQPRLKEGNLPLHDRFIVIHLDHVHRDGKTIPPAQFIADYYSFALGIMRLSTALRGGAARDMRERRAVTPEDLFDLSPWTSDICLASNDAMLIYHEPEPAIEPDAEGEFAAFTHRKYWESIERGAEWMITLRTELQLIERQATDLLAKLSPLTMRIHDGALSDEDRRQLDELAEGVSRAFNVLPQLRYALVPSSVSHAADAVHIFSHLMDEFGMHGIANHVNVSMEELSDFLSYYSSTQLQYESRDREEAENRTGLTISIMLILLSLVSVPSLIKDASDINWAALALRPDYEELLVLILAALPIVLLLITGIYAYRKLNRR